jgi:flagellar assembly protein FliH
MSSRIIRGDDRTNRIKVTAPSEGGLGASALLPDNHVLNVEKAAFEQGYNEGERVGKQMGERIVDAVVKRYDRGIQGIVQAHRDLVEAMEKQTVQLALEISRKIVQREVSIDQDFLCALASVAIKRVQGHGSIVLRVSPDDYVRASGCTAKSNPAVTVQEDSTLDRGDFVLDTAQTHLDGRISSQIEAIGRALLDV